MVAKGTSSSAVPRTLPRESRRILAVLGNCVVRACLECSSFEIADLLLRRVE